MIPTGIVVLHRISGRPLNPKRMCIPDFTFPIVSVFLVFHDFVLCHKLNLIPCYFWLLLRSFILSTAYRDLVQRKNSTASSNNIFKSSPVITISASSQTALSFVRVYFDAAKDRVYPFLTAIMDVERGVVKGITWDNACVFCGGTECLENTYNYNGAPQNQSSAGQTTRSCFVSTEDCNALLGSNSSSTVCDITVYTVWTGTDANGIALQSQAYRFSEFPAQELSDRITQLLVPDAAADLINSGGGDGSNTTRNRLLPSSSHGAAAVLQVMEDHYHQSQSVDGTNGAVHSAVISEEGDL